jgi:hypothetical protein
MSTTTDLRPALLKTYKYVVNNWAVSAREAAEGTDTDPKATNNLLKRLAGAGLLDSTHVNGEKSLTWQSMFDVQNDKQAGRKSTAAFNKAFPKGEVVSPAPKRNGATGARYTEEQLATGRDARVGGSSWAEVAKVAGVKSPFHFSKAVRKAHPRVEKEREQAAKKASAAA